jgi:hypothetical protein
MPKTSKRASVEFSPDLGVNPRIFCPNSFISREERILKYVNTLLNSSLQACCGTVTEGWYLCPGELDSLCP